MLKRGKKPPNQNKDKLNTFFANCSEKLQQRLNVLLWLKQKPSEDVSCCQSWCFHVSSKPSYNSFILCFHALTQRLQYWHVYKKHPSALIYLRKSAGNVQSGHIIAFSLTSPLALSVTLHPLIQGSIMMVCLLRCSRPITGLQVAWHLKKGVRV